MKGKVFMLAYTSLNSSSKRLCKRYIKSWKESIRASQKLLYFLKIKKNNTLFIKNIILYCEIKPPTDEFCHSYGCPI